MRFAGVGAEGYSFFIERVPAAEALAQLDRLKELQRQGWDVEWLGATDGSHLIGLGCRYLEEPAAVAK